MSMNESVFQYALDVDDISCVMVGVDSVEQMRENLMISENGPLDLELMNIIADCIENVLDHIVNPAEWRM